MRTPRGWWQKCFTCLQKCLTAGRVPGGCVCRMGVACCAARSKHADAGRSLPFALWCPSPAMPCRAGCWHGPWMWFGRRLAVVRFLFCNPWRWGWAGSSRKSWTVASLGYSLVLGYPGWAPSSLSHVPTPLALQPVLTSQGEFRDKIPCFQPHFHRLEAPDPAGKEEA